MTVDVETYSLTTGRYDLEVGREICTSALPTLLELFSKYDVKATFYLTGEFTEVYPEAVRLIKNYDSGHEIGSHGYSHSRHHAFDNLNYTQQVNELRKSKLILEKNINERIISFRAPALRVNADTVKALETVGYHTDSSVCPQRFDGPLTYGAKHKLRWLVAPRRPYYPSYNSITAIGNSKILEIPISALILPYIGTALRIVPRLIRWLEAMLFFEARYRNIPIVFLIHPNELLEPTISSASTQLKFTQVFAGKLRHKLKLRNLGKRALELVEAVIERVTKKFDPEFITVKHYWKLYRKSTQSYNFL